MNTHRPGAGQEKTSAAISGYDEVRAAFLAYFQRADHRILPSAPLVLPEDTSLLFVNSGMVPFKSAFTGASPPPAPRVASAQKCMRAGGKHNDLENVGHTARHHTFFEMLGNFSFGDYFKEQAISHAWAFLTGELGLQPGKLWVTVHADDEESAALWPSISGLPASRVLPIATADNFWSMGNEGPCGPCSEIFYDHGAHVAGGLPGTAEADGDRFVEIWNLVFMQFDQHASGQRVALPVPSVDTGMGLERICAVLQGVCDNYETDLFQTLIAAGEDVYAARAEGEARHSLRILADHVRSVSFLIADGVSPANEGRGYVLRRIMRRAMRHGHKLGARTPLMHAMVPALSAAMGAAYPELRMAEAAIVDAIRREEERFQDMLGRGLLLLDEEIARLGSAGILPGTIAFKMYDTYGFPLDLTRDILRGKSMDVDEAGFDAAMAKQRRLTKGSWKNNSADTAAVWSRPPWGSAPSGFDGYVRDDGDAQLVGIVQDGKPVQKLTAPAKAELVAARTPFYARSGGQSADHGSISFPHGASFTVTDVHKRPGDVHAHEGQLVSGEIAVGQTAFLKIDGARRQGLRIHHSATHLLHAALRRHLGPHVTQKGSLVEADRLRFDFSHGKSLRVEDIMAIEKNINAVIRDNGPAVTEEMTPADAVEAGALALFGEKYGDKARVLRLGRLPREEKGEEEIYSVELCGGTHVAHTGEIGLFVVTGESGIAAGVRRIEAVAGQAALTWLQDRARQAGEMADILGVPLAEAGPRLHLLLDEHKKRTRDLAEARRALAMAGSGGKTDDGQIDEIKGTKLLARRIDGAGGADLRALVDDGKKRLGDGVIAFVSVNEGKAALAVGVCGTACSRFDAIALVREGARCLGGRGGGGRPDMAQAGGPLADGADQALEAVRAYLAR